MVYYFSDNKYPKYNIRLRVGVMLKLKIPSIPPTTSKSIRFPNDIINKIEVIIRNKNCTFSAFVIHAVKLF